jgi:hypothetical protein
MEAIRTIVNKVNNSITVDIPKSIKSIKFEVIVMPLDDNNAIVDWQQLTKNNSAFDFLNDPEEDIYTINDGKPYER